MKKPPRETGLTLKSKLEKADLKVLTKTKGWLFDWEKEYSATDRKCYKLMLENSNEIQAIISIQDQETHFWMHAIETAPHNFGTLKKYDGVLKSMTAFVCKMSFEYGYLGEVGFISKTKLITHYEKEIEAVHIRNGRMIIFEPNARKIASLYFLISPYEQEKIHKRPLHWHDYSWRFKSHRSR